MDIKERKQFYLNHFEKQKSSGLGVKTYCKENGISDSSFYSWRKRLSKDHNLSSNFVSKDHNLSSNYVSKDHNLSSNFVSNDHNLSSNFVRNSLEDDDTELDFMLELTQKKNTLLKKFILTISVIVLVNIIWLIVGMSSFMVLLIIGSYLGATINYLYRTDSISKTMRRVQSDELI